MAPKARSAALSVGLAVLIAGCGRTSSAPEKMSHGTASAALESIPNSQPGGPSHTFVMPHDEPLFPPGPGREEFVTACVVCHSPRYITMQPRFSRSTWIEEVNKMKNVYGAHISDEQAVKIATYLVFVNGKPDDAGAPKGAVYGE